MTEATDRRVRRYISQIRLGKKGDLLLLNTPISGENRIKQLENVEIRLGALGLLFPESETLTIRKEVRW